MLEADRRYTPAALRSGDASAWEQLIADTKPALRRALSRSGVARQDLEDFEQESYLKLFERRGHLDPGGNLQAYVNKTGRNLSLDAHRRAQSCPMVQEADTRGDEEGLSIFERQAASDDTEEAALSALKHEQLRDALQQLPAEQRDVLTMECAGLLQREIAALTGAPLGTVKTRDRLGKERLRGLLTNSNDS